MFIVQLSNFSWDFQSFYHIIQLCITDLQLKVIFENFIIVFIFIIFCLFSRQKNTFDVNVKQMLKLKIEYHTLK